MATCGKCKGHATTAAEIRACYAGHPNAHGEAADAKRIENHGDNRVYLNVPYAEKDRVKSEPFWGKWDPQKRQWWVTPGTMKKFGKLMPEAWKGESTSQNRQGPEEGFYKVIKDDAEGIEGSEAWDFFQVYRTKHGMRPGTLVAKVLVPINDPESPHGKWQYIGRSLLTKIAIHGKALTLEEAQNFGKLYGFCVRCGRTLTDEGSKAAGIGPICAGKWHEHPPVSMPVNDGPPL
ncbi:hypothetical protein SEA_LILYPAD_40 [Gordonia phage LilyPad]|nr:hypothetical protein SEA_LILYPAD_40 [Gordonia phage LilyPad]